ncbi:hypothetical protein B296_00035096, partial [Ensete ventricosum]
SVCLVIVWTTDIKLILSFADFGARIMSCNRSSSGGNSILPCSCFEFWSTRRYADFNQLTCMPNERKLHLLPLCWLAYTTRGGRESILQAKVTVQSKMSSHRTTQAMDCNPALGTTKPKGSHRGRPPCRLQVRESDGLVVSPRLLVESMEALLHLMESSCTQKSKS